MMSTSPFLASSSANPVEARGLAPLPLLGSALQSCRKGGGNEPEPTPSSPQKGCSLENRADRGSCARFVMRGPHPGRLRPGGHGHA